MKEVRNDASGREASRGGKAPLDLRNIPPICLVTHTHRPRAESLSRQGHGVRFRAGPTL
jgi:hypothetical protein